jgi:hypothetical protein
MLGASVTRETSRLLAIVYPMLARARVGGRLGEWSRQAYLANWTANSALVARVAPRLEALDAAGCRPVLLKGLALLLGVYRDLGVRGGADVDVLVDPDRADLAWRVLAGANGVPDRRGTLATLQDVRDVYHAWQFRFPDGVALDLHWTPLGECCAPAIARRFSTGSQEASIAGLAARVPCVEHLLVHALVHGIRRDWWAPGRNALDAATIVAGHDLRWAEMWDLARAAGVEHAAHAALVRLARFCPLPDGWDAARRSRAPSIAERVEVWAWRRDQFSLRDAPLARLLEHVSRYRRLRRFHPAWRTRGPGDYWRAVRREKGSPGPSARRSASHAS